MPEQLPDHAHCLICDAAIPFDKKFCSEKCENDFREASKKSKRRVNLFIVIVIVLIIAIGTLSILF
jgi:predicted nucleic acid-binding Zn ribbon protein